MHIWCNRTTIDDTRAPWSKARTTIKNASTLANFILYPIILYRFTWHIMEKKDTLVFFVYDTGARNDRFF